MPILRLSFALLLVQAGFHAYSATLPLALARAGTAEATVGVIMGVAAVVQIPAAIAGGRLLDRFGGPRLFLVGGLAYLLATLVLLLPGVDVAGSLAPFVVVRILQGAGIALAMPSALSQVPRLVPATKVAASLSYVQAAQNLTLVLAPPLSLALLDAFSLDGVAAAVIGVLLAGLVLGRGLPLRDAEPSGRVLEAAGRRFGITFRRAWAVPLLIVVSYVAHWGAVTAYLPIRAEQAGADIGLYFAADGIAIFAMRFPTAWLVDRISSRVLILVGAGATAIAIAMLLLPLSTELLVVSGLLGGAGGGIVLTPVTVELSRRSSDADRGSAFSLLSGGIATAMTLGSIGGAPLVAVSGMAAALAAGLVLIAVSMVLAAADGSLAGTAHRGDGEPAPA